MGNSQGKPVVFTDQVNLNHFRLLRVVGKGAFGKVRIVERKDNGATYALKYIRKDEVVRSESVRNIIRERRMLEHLNHPFICNLRYSFQDVEYLYLVVDLMTGGDLRFHISRKTFTEDAVRFWMAELGCAIRYVHQQGIVHRDVKPDNVLIDADGHAHLADFNVASEIKPGKELTSKSGTLAYLAPEVYAGKGYSTEVDWWSLGVVFYEAIFNKRPFDAHSHESLSQKIQRADVPFPVTNPPVSQPCLHAMSSLLEKDKHQRIGAKSWESFYDNPFFRTIDFEALMRREVQPVFVPSSEKTNFDATYDLEELLLEEAPLEARARRQKPREALKQDATEAEIRAEELHRMIETMFEPFDYTAASFDKVDPNNTLPAVITTDSDNGRPPKTGGSESAVADNLKTSAVTPVQSRSRASTQSPNGSPPLPTTNMGQQIPPGGGSMRSRPDGFNQGAIPLNGQPAPAAGDRPDKRRKGMTRSTSAGGGAQYVVHATGSWSELGQPNPANGPPVEGGEEGDMKRPSGMLGFLSRKKGRDRSPKARERGVLGKEGARVVVNNG